jgi:Chaperone of endosialidase
MRNKIHHCLVLLLTFSGLSLSAQSPEGFNYQAVARDNAGKLMINKSITVKTIVLSGPSASKKVYEEIHALTTNAYGHFQLIVGQGSTSGDFSAIDWASEPHHLKVEIDQGSGFAFMGTVHLQSVPYALHSKTADSVTNLNLSTDDINDINSAGATSGNVLKWNGSEWVPGIDDNSTTAYTGEVGIDVSDSVISAKNTDALWNASQIQGVDIKSGSPTKDQVMQFDGADWTYATLSGSGSGSASQWDTTGNGIYYNKGGNVGINTDNPFSRLHVQDSLTSTANGNFIMVDNYMYGGRGAGARYTAQRSVVFGQGGGSNIGSMNVSAGSISSTGEAIATYSEADGAYNTGVFSNVGEDASTQAIAFLGLGRGQSTFNLGLYSVADRSNSGTNYGVFAVADSGSTNYAGYFIGNVTYTGTLASASDARLKQNINSLSNATSIIKELQPKTYFYKQEGEASYLKLSKGLQYGFLAQELEKVLPELVSDQVQMKGLKQEGSIKYKAVNYTALIPVLTQALKEQQDVIESLEKRITELEQAGK